MSIAQKFAAFGAAAAISATGLVAATGVSANAADYSVAYTCSDTLGAVSNGTVTTTFTIAPTVARSADAHVSVSAKVTFPQAVSDAAAALAAGGSPEIDGSMSGTVGFGSTTGALNLVMNHAPIKAGGPSTVPATGSITVAANNLGAQAVTLPSTMTATINTPLGADKVNCTAAAGADLAAGSVTVTAGSATVGHTPSPALKAAQAKLAKDQKALAAAKQALKKAKGHKKVVAKKKVAKLTKAVKADLAKVKSLSK